MHYLVTGHTGFKGGWLALLLKAQGHTVSGISLDPMPKSVYSEAKLSNIFEEDLRCDIRNQEELQKQVKAVNADVVIHLAAQALVRESYKDPIGTFETNVIGTLNLLDSLKQTTNTKSALIITTDKVYKNINKQDGYVEGDALGGNDPYSASKSAADIGAQSWIENFADIPIAIARAGNVIGTGDWAQDRLIPDLISSFDKNLDVVLRYPDAIRPWQHVLDCLNGYLCLVDSSLKKGTAGEWNFGPSIQLDKTVAVVAEAVSTQLNSNNSWVQDSGNFPRETGLLLLDSSKARANLNWRDKLNFSETIKWTVEGYQSVIQGEPTRNVLENQIQTFLAL